MNETRHDEAYPFFPLDELVDEVGVHDAPGSHMDLWIAAMCFKTLDSLPRRLPFVVEVVTRRTSLWQRLLQDSPCRYWLPREWLGVALYPADDDYGCARLYVYGGTEGLSSRRPPGLSWDVAPDLATLRARLDTAENRARHKAWLDRRAQGIAKSEALVNGRLANTGVKRALVVSVGDGCVVCGQPATMHASTTLSAGPRGAMIHLPLCEAHAPLVHAHPSVLAFAASVLPLDLELPQVVWHDRVPDALIEPLRCAVAAELGAQPQASERRERSWHLRFTLPSGWWYLLRVNTLRDYAYMLFDPVGKERYRADSAPDHPELAFFPDHEHSRPDRPKRDKVAPSFLYGNPILDLKRLKDIATDMGAYLDPRAPTGSR